MKHRTLHLLAALGLSACLLAGGAASAFAEETPACTEHVWKRTTELKTECINTKVSLNGSDGKLRTYTLCPECGHVENAAALTEVRGVNANFSGLKVFTGTLDGQQVLSVAFCYPTVIERVVCETCGTVRSEDTTAARAMAADVTANVELPASAVAGYTLYQTQADGTEAPVEVSINDSTALMRLYVGSGAQLLRMVPNA